MRTFESPNDRPTRIVKRVLLASVAMPNYVFYSAILASEQNGGYLSSRRASPPLYRYQIILLGDRGTCVWTTCPMFLPESARPSSCLTRGVGAVGTTAALAPAMLKPRGESIFSPPQYFPTFLYAVPQTSTLCRYVAYIQLKRHTQLVLQVTLLRNKLTKHTSPARISR